VIGIADNALGAFLRARREAVPPAAVGLPTGPGRRTPGLCRGELAGVSVEYLTRLERGADRRPSPQVLGAHPAGAALVRLRNEVNERRNPRTKATPSSFSTSTWKWPIWTPARCAATSATIRTT
jgi:Helix-turn-helix domain